MQKSTQYTVTVRTQNPPRRYIQITVFDHNHAPDDQSGLELFLLIRRALDDAQEQYQVTDLHLLNERSQERGEANELSDLSCGPAGRTDPTE